MSDLKMQSVFDDATETEKAFDTMFGGDEDDHLIETVLMLDEDGTKLPDEEELHQTDDEATPKDLADELGEGHDTDNKPTADSNGEFDIEDEGLDIGCEKTGVSDAVQKGEVDPENIEDEADTEAEKMEKSYNEALAELMREAEEELGVEPTVGADDKVLGDPKEDQLGDEVKTESEEKDLSDDLEDDDEDEDDNDDEPEVVDDEECEKGDNDCEEKDLSDDLEDDDEDESDKDDNDDEPEEKEIKEASDVEDEDSLVEDLEDEIIDAVEDDSELSSKEVKKLDSDYDDDLIDIVAGQK